MVESVDGNLSTAILQDKFGPNVEAYVTTILEIYNMHTTWSSPSLKVSVNDAVGKAVVTIGEDAHIDTYALRRLGDTTAKFDTMCRRVVVDFQKNMTIYDLHNVSNEPRRYEVEEAEVVRLELVHDPGIVVRHGAEFSDMPDCVDRKRIQRIISLYSASSKRIPQFRVLSEVFSANTAKLYLTNIRNCDAALLHRLVRDSMVNASRVVVKCEELQDGALSGHGEMTLWLPVTTKERGPSVARRRGFMRRLMRTIGC